MIRVYIMFQFLIGRLKTEQPLRPLDYPFEFQFLIGRLKTYIPCGLFVLNKISFNSL